MIGALDLPLAVTFFADRTANSATSARLTLRQLAGRIMHTHAPVKAALPWLKLATFGDHRGPGGSLRNNANLRTITGIEADYDGMDITLPEAAARMRAAGLAALLYTSPSHHPDLPRWRVLCPCSEPLNPAERAALTARVNGVLGGIVAPESFTPSQAYFYGYVEPNPEHASELVEGEFIDLRPDLPAVHPIRAAAEPLTLPPFDPAATPDTRAQQALAVALGAFASPRTDTGRHQVLLSATNAVAPFIRSGHLDVDSVAIDLAGAMTAGGREPNPREVESALNGALRFAQPYRLPSDGSEFQVVPDVAPPPRRKLFVSRDFKLDACQGYVIKHLIAPGNVCALLGQPGAGKSTLAPYLAYAVAQGRPVFGLRTTRGRTLYCAAEDLAGIKKRIGALGMQHGHSDDCAVVECGNLREPEPRAELFATVVDFKPSLVILDTVAAAFAGMEENGSQDMGMVVEFARHLATTGAAVLLIHHPAKNGDGTARGHSVLNGTLDMAITLAADDVSDPDTVVRGKTPKNRQGTTARTFEFRKVVVTLGTDGEGDPITTTLPVELDATDRVAERPKLTGQPAKALQALRDVLAGTEAVTRDGAAMVPESVWQAECDARALSSSDRPESQGRVFRRAAGDLISAGEVVRLDGFVGLPDRYADKPDNACPSELVHLSAGAAPRADRTHPFRGVRVRPTGHPATITLSNHQDDAATAADIKELLH